MFCGVNVTKRVINVFSYVSNGTSRSGACFVYRLHKYRSKEILCCLFYLYFSLFICLILVMGDPVDHATGIEKRELLAKLAGNDNPFDMKVFKRGPGTKASPNLIPSAFDARLVGCICEEDQTFVQWMWLHQVSVLVVTSCRIHT